MQYIIQKQVPIVVNTKDFEGDLKQHPCIVDNPDLFEVVSGDLPKEYTTLNYQKEVEE